MRGCWSHTEGGIRKARWGFDENVNGQKIDEYCTGDLTVIGSACSLLTIIGLSKSSAMGGLLYESDTDSDSLIRWMDGWLNGAGSGGWEGGTYVTRRRGKVFLLAV